MEVAAVRASRDYQEVGTFKPNVRSFIAYNAASDITPTVRTNGVLMGQITPAEGSSAAPVHVVQFDAWNWEDAVFARTMASTCTGLRRTTSIIEDGRAQLRKRKTYDQKLHEIRDFFARARAYARQDRKRTCAWRPCAACLPKATAVPREQPRLFIHANRCQANCGSHSF